MKRRGTTQEARNVNEHAFRRRIISGRAAQSSRLTRKKLLLFSTVTVLLLIALIEAALRLAGYGGLPRFFVPVLEFERSTLLRTNTNALWPYFGRQTDASANRVGSIVNERVLVPKPPRLLRVVMVGESSVQGFPYPRNLTAAAFLEKYLQARSPDRQVEVINAGITAVASYPLRRIVEEALDLQPDLLIIYAGHNEYFGAFGAASAQGAGTRQWQRRITLGARSTAIFQATLTAAEKLTALSKSVAGDERTLMERMATENLIAPEAPIRRLAEQSLSANINFMLLAANRKKVPVLLCSLAANERDLIPVRSIPWPEEARRKWENVFARAQVAAKSESFPAVRALYHEAQRLHPQHALTHWHLGQALEAEGDTTSALAEYRRARDDDAMPWRGSSRFNDLLRQSARKASVTFADVDSHFHEKANGAPGWRLFADHLHPSLEGQALWAESLLGAIEREQLLPLQSQPPDDWRFVARLLGDNRLVRWRVAHRMAGLFQRPPLDHDTSAALHAERERKAVLNECEPFERRAAQLFLTDTSQDIEPWSISFVGGAEALKESLYDKATDYFRCAMNEAGRYSEHRASAAYYRYFALAVSGKYSKQFRGEAANELQDALHVELATKANSVALNHAVAGLHLLQGDDVGAKKYAARLPKKSEIARQWQKEQKQLELSSLSDSVVPVRPL